MKPQQTSAISTARVVQHLQMRFNPIRQLDPTVLSRALDGFASGHLREAAMLFEAIERRDDQIAAVAAKRKKAVARNGYDILTVENSPEAVRHQEALKYFYDNLTATNAIDRNQRGGVRLLVRQMMDAVSKGFATHEIIMRPSRAGQLTATFNFVPLWFFENITGKLRFLESDFALAGRDLEEGGWMVTTGDALMIACSVAYMYKTLSLRDWVIYNERHGMPGFLGKTSTTPGSPQWDAMVEAVQTISAEWAGVISTGDSVDVLDLKGSPSNPYQPLIERMDRSIACLYRGADLSTLSGGDQTGASIQGDETDILEADDVGMISETLNDQVDRLVIRTLFGEDVEPLAYFELKTAVGRNIDRQIKIDEHMDKSGIRETKAARAERYGRAVAGDNIPEADLVSVTNTPAPGAPALPPVSLGNEAKVGEDPAVDEYLARARLAVAQGLQADLKPLALALAGVMESLSGSDAITEADAAALTRFRDEQLPKLLADAGADSATATAFADVFSASFLGALAKPEAKS